MSKPSVVLVPGAWHDGSHYELFLERLRKDGYLTISGQLPSTWDFVDRAEQSVTADAEFIRSSWLLPEIESGKDVILVAHSYGGFPGGASAKGLSKAERTAAGKPGGVIGLIFMTAFVGHDGASLQSSVPGNELAPWTVVEDGGVTGVTTPEQIFYNGTDPALAAKAVQGLHKHALTAFTTPSGPPAWKDDVFNGRRAYVKCAQDGAIPLVAQNAMVSMSGVEWNELELDADHSPFMNHIEELAKFVNELTAEWTK